MKPNEEELVKQHIKDVPNKSDDELVHYLKCASSRSQKPYKDLVKAIETERKKREKPKASQIPKEVQAKLDNL